MTNHRSYTAAEVAKLRGCTVANVYKLARVVGIIEAVPLKHRFSEEEKERLVGYVKRSRWSAKVKA